MNSSLTPLATELSQLLATDICSPAVAEQYRQFIESQQITRDNNDRAHYCVYFAPFDPTAQQVFIGYHKKAGQWLFNGGHVDDGEAIADTLIREIGEEWGLSVDISPFQQPQLLTITEIDNPTKQTCRRHYDIWCFVSVDQATFMPDQDRLSEEFKQVQWLSIPEARQFVTDPATQEALTIMSSLMHS